jgi:hypothetical protein
MNEKQAHSERITDSEWAIVFRAIHTGKPLISLGTVWRVLHTALSITADEWLGKDAAVILPYLYPANMSLKQHYEILLKI